jgi:hypothetical protein
MNFLGDFNMFLLQPPQNEPLMGQSLRPPLYPNNIAHFTPQPPFLPPIDSISPPNISIFAFNGLNSPYSNAVESFVIDDFAVFNVYIHNNLRIINRAWV